VRTIRRFDPLPSKVWVFSLFLMVSQAMSSHLKLYQFDIPVPILLLSTAYIIVLLVLYKIYLDTKTMVMYSGIMLRQTKQTRETRTMKYYTIIVIDKNYVSWLHQDSNGYYYIDSSNKESHQRVMFCASNNTSKMLMWMSENVPTAQFKIVEHNWNNNNPAKLM
jgi:hypothetical protein